MQLVTWDDLVKTGGLGNPGGFAKDQSLTGAELSRPAAVTIGVFDGIHRGHRALIGKIVDKAPVLLPAVLTFRDNPKKYVRPEAFEGDILDYREKIRLFGELGVKLCVIIDFSADFCKLEGREFFSLMYRFLRPAYVAVGSNFHCGFDRGTGAGAFRLLGQEKGVEVEIVPPVLENGLPVSSSRIRSALRAGSYEEAALLLGRPVTAGQMTPR
ncbi:MAG: FAD synthetase family protein [Treponema sp.]|jgi:riboflavin kinase/FMN adenylyltransferase|nr:FAD synthetase family protein [Treponema sp.]